MRTYQVVDEGDEVQLQLFEDGMQMGGGVFPRSLDTVDFDPWDEACAMGDDWVAYFPACR